MEIDEKAGRKNCSLCGKSKQKNEFYNSCSSKDGLTYWCKQCFAEYGTRYRHVKNTDKEENFENKNTMVLNDVPREAWDHEPILLIEMPTGNGQIELALKCPLAKDTISWIVVQLDRIIQFTPSISINGMKISGASEIAKVRDICDAALKKIEAA